MKQEQLDLFNELNAIVYDKIEKGMPLNQIVAVLDRLKETCVALYSEK